MAALPSQIARLMDRLDHPDAILQREVMDRLVGLGAEAVPAIAANLMLVAPRVRRALVQVLGELGDDRALLPLMRYVFDLRGDVAESDGRALGMQAILKLAGKDDPGRLFAFAAQMRHDADAFVRARALELFALLEDPRALPYAQDGLEDADEFVRARASAALERLGAIEVDDSMAAAELLDTIFQSSGNELAFHLEALQRREDGFELACKLVEDGGSRVSAGLRALQVLGDPRARRIAMRVFEQSSSADHKAMATRVLAANLRQDATDEEAQLVTRALHHSDRFVHLAGLQAAGASGREALVGLAVKAARSSEPDLALAAADAFAQAASPQLDALLPEARETFKRVHVHRLLHATEEWVRAEAFVLRGLTKLVAKPGSRSDGLHRHAFDALQAVKPRRAGAQAVVPRPIVVTALELLHRITPPEGLAATKRWSPEDTLRLCKLLSHRDGVVRRRVIDLLKAGAPPNFDEMAPFLEDVEADAAVSIIDDIIPLLVLARGAHAKRALQRLAAGDDDPDVSTTAATILREWRNEAPFIDVRFEPRNDS